MPHPEGQLVDIGDTRLFVVDVGDADADPLLVLHGGPGVDHHMFADYLDPLTERGIRLLLVDHRANGRSDRPDPSTWTLPQMAADVGSLAAALGLARYSVLGHSFGAFVTLQHAVDFPGAASRSIVSGGLPSARFLSKVDENLAAFEPVELRDQVTASWAKEASVDSQAAFAELMHEQWPFHFRDPLDPRIEEAERRMAGTVYSPECLRAFASNDYGAIEVEDRLGTITQPVLLLAGRYDRTCVLEAHEAMAAAIPDAELVVFDESGHMTYVEENAKYLDAVEAFLRRTR
jgi:proline iminopeptidase